MKGFTLVEILIVIAVLSIVMAGLFSLLNIADLSWYTDMGIVDLQQQARRAMDGMVREIRQSKYTTINISDGGQRIDFKIPIDLTSSPVTYSDNITYHLDSTNHAVVRSYAGTNNITIGSDINYLNFSSSGNIVNIVLNTKKITHQREIYFPSKIAGVEQFLVEKVRLRNE